VLGEKPLPSEDALRMVGFEKCDWMFRGFNFPNFLIDPSPVQIASAWVFTTSGDKSSGGDVSLCTESAARLLVVH
jgi:hypothetical protein